MDSSKDKRNFYVPLCIMVSDDTHDRTIDLLEKHNYFGLDKSHIDIVKQENVPALCIGQEPFPVKLHPQYSAATGFQGDASML